MTGEAGSATRIGLLGLLALIAFGTADMAKAQIAPSASDISAYRGLHAAAAAGDVEELRNLARQGSNLETRDGYGRTALHIAAHGSHHAFVRELAGLGADMRAKDGQRYDVITIAAVRDDVEMIRLAVALGSDPKAITSPYDGTALIAAAHLGHAEVVRTLIQAGAPLDHVNNLGWTAAMEAVILGDGGKAHQDTLKSLLDAGADAAIADRDGRTPLDHARQRGFDAMVQLLVAARR